MSIKDLVAKEIDCYFYIYPITRVSDLNVGNIILIVYQAGVSLESMLPKRSLPYRNARIINVIREVYFTGGVSSFATRFEHLFPRHRDGQGVTRTEVPCHMVALVATAVRCLSCFNINANSYLQCRYMLRYLTGAKGKVILSTLRPVRTLMCTMATSIRSWACAPIIPTSSMP